MRTRHLSMALAVALALSLAACGGRGGGAAGTAAPATTATTATPATTATTAAPATTRSPVSQPGRVEDVPDGARGYQVALLAMNTTDDNGELVASDRERLLCGGSLIDQRHVLTAAHCFDDAEVPDPPDPKRDLRVVVGRTVLNSSAGQVRRVAAVALHPRWGSAPGLADDVAVITLDRPVSGIQPVRLVDPGAGLVQVGAVATFSGWGDARSIRDGRDDAAATRDRMKAGHVAIVAGAACTGAYAGSHQRLAAESLRLCTSTSGGVGHCYADSGGPLVVEAGGAVVQIGVVSLALGCGDPRYPSVYARLDNPNINAFVRGRLAGSG